MALLWKFRNKNRIINLKSTLGIKKPNFNGKENRH